MSHVEHVHRELFDDKQDPEPPGGRGRPLCRGTAVFSAHAPMRRAQNISVIHGAPPANTAFAARTPSSSPSIIPTVRSAAADIYPV